MALKNLQKADPNFVPNYQLSGIPYVTSSAGSALGTSPVEIKFPHATKSVTVSNRGGSDIRFGFTKHGVNGVEDAFYYKIPANAAGKENTHVFDVRCKVVFLRTETGNSDFSLFAALTPIAGSDFPVITGSNGFAGVG